MPDQPDFAEIRARAEAATAGAWGITHHQHPATGCRCLSCFQPTTVLQPGGLYCDDVPQQGSWDQPDEGTRCDAFGYAWPDADFISHAREDMLILLDYLDYLDSEVPR